MDMKHRDHLIFSHKQHSRSHMRDPTALRWELIYALTINVGLWLLIIRGAQFLLSRNPFG